MTTRTIDRSKSKTATKAQPRTHDEADRQSNRLAIDPLVAEVVRLREKIGDVQTEASTIADRFCRAVGVSRWAHPNVNVARAVSEVSRTLEQAWQETFELADFIASDDALSMDDIPPMSERDEYRIEQERELQRMLDARKLRVVSKSKMFGPQTPRKNLKRKGKGRKAVSA